MNSKPTNAESDEVCADCGQAYSKHSPLTKCCPTCSLQNPCDHFTSKHNSKIESDVCPKCNHPTHEGLCPEYNSVDDINVGNLAACSCAHFTSRPKVETVAVWTKEELADAEKSAKETMKIMEWDKCDCEVLGEHCPVHKHLHEQLAALKAENAELRKYAQHIAPCWRSVPDNRYDKCTCGLTQLLEGGRE